MNVDDIRRIAVIGAGLMGHGVAQEFAVAGYEVHLHDLTDKHLEQAIKDIQRDLQMLVGAGVVTRAQADSTLPNIHPSTVLEAVVSDVDVVIEAVDEDLALKCPNGMSVSEFMAGTIRHDTWHASQVAVARRLFRTSR